MSDKKISELNILNSKPDDNDLFPFVHNGQTTAVSYKNIISNDNLFSGSVVRTIYSRSNTVSYTAGLESVDLMLGDSNSTFGSREIVSNFFDNNFTSKIISFRTFGKFSNNTGSVDVSIAIGPDLILNSSLGSVSLTQPQNHPFEIFGEIVFNGTSVVTCYSLGHCANNGDFKRYPLSDPTTPQSITNFVGGDIKLMFFSNTISVSTYGGIIQVLT